MENKIAIVMGTRPEIIKIYPIIREIESLVELDRNVIVIWTGQHYDYEMSKIFFEELSLKSPDYFLNIDKYRPPITKTFEIVAKLTKIIERNNIKYIYSLGDTISTLSAALAAFYTDRVFIHDEAGMRSFNTLMYEELNRKIADYIANIRLAPTKLAVLNLLIEGYPNKSIHLVGSTVTDVIRHIVTNYREKEKVVLDKYGISKNEYFILTIHRRENLCLKKLHEIFLALEMILNKYDYKIVFPMHPHTKKKIIDLGLWDKILNLKGLIITKPLGYLDFIFLLKNSKVVLTDSGGVQEESFILKKPTITLRESTEWPETVIWGYNKITGTNSCEILSIVDYYINEWKPYLFNFEKNPLGDGKSSKRIVKILRNLIESPTLLPDKLGIMRGIIYKIPKDDPILIPCILKMNKKEEKSVLMNICMKFNYNGIPDILLQDNSDTKSYYILVRYPLKSIMKKISYTDEDIIKMLEVKWDTI